jgi:SAM-dependent methyltransferase
MSSPHHTPQPSVPGVVEDDPAVAPELGRGSRGRYNRPAMSSQDGLAADDWDVHWDRYGSAAQGNPANSYRHHLILSGMRGYPPRIRIVDIGSGQGELAVLLAHALPESEIRGVEYSAAGVERAREMAATANVESRLTFSQRDLLRPLALQESERGWATVATCSEVLEHVDSPEVLLANSMEYLAPESRIIVTVPGGPRTAFDRHIGHRTHFTKRSLRDLLDNSGFDVLEVRQAGFPFFNLYKLVVLLRGKALIAELDQGDSSPPSRLAGAVLRIFDIAFRWNLPSSPFGWQLIAVATPKLAQ